MKLPEPKDDLDWSRLRQHDVDELWDYSTQPHVAASYAARMSLLLEKIGALAGHGGRILDVGCAQGTLGLMLAERGHDVTLVDFRRGNIDYARARYERGKVSFYVGLVENIAFPRADFDVVVCTEVLEHVREPAKLIMNLAARARPGGRLCLTTPNAEYLFSRLPSFGAASQDVIDSAESNSADGNDHRYLFTRDELIALIRGAGLGLEEHGFFLPAWLEGHLKTRYLHRALFRARGDILRLPAAMARQRGYLARRLCSSQWIIANRG